MLTGVTYVWGNKNGGIAIQRKERTGKGRYSWDVVHIKNGKIVLRHRDYTKTDAIREAHRYARYEKQHGPRS
jgi:ketosteroid isomerase-like protein